MNFWLSRCEAKRGYIAWTDGSCQQLYVRGPCTAGQWVVPDHAKGRRRGRGSSWRLGKCECLPSFTATVDMTGHVTCLPPTVTLAHYLNTQADATWQDWSDQSTDSLLRLFPSLGADNMTHLVESKTWKSSTWFLVTTFKLHQCLSSYRNIHENDDYLIMSRLAAKTLQFKYILVGSNSYKS